MRKLQIAFIGTFIAGVLLTGIGVGVAMVEYSSLQYGGEKLLGGGALATKVMEFQMPEDGGIVILGEHQRSDLKKVSGIVENPAIPEGVLQYEITYNADLVEPYLHFEEYVQEESAECPEQPEFTDWKEPAENAPGRPQGQQEGNDQDAQLKEEPEEPDYAGSLQVCLEYTGDDLKIFMSNKDIILQELKERRISSYRSVYVTEIRIQVNPETRPYLEDAFAVY